MRFSKPSKKIPPIDFRDYNKWLESDRYKELVAVKPQPKKSSGLDLVVVDDYSPAPDHDKIDAAYNAYTLALRQHETIKRNQY